MVVARNYKRRENAGPTEGKYKHLQQTSQNRHPIYDN
jgi:hypothetical protein